METNCTLLIRPFSLVPKFHSPYKPLFLVKFKLSPKLTSALEKSISWILQEELLDRKLPSLCEGVCGKCSHWLDRIPWLLSSGNYSVPILHAPSAIRYSMLDWTDVTDWRQMVKFHFSLGNVTLMDTSNFFQPGIHLFSSWVHSRLLNLRLTGSASGNNCTHNNKLNFH